MQKVAGERYVYKFVCDPEALFTMAFPDNHRPVLKTEPPREDFYRDQHPATSISEAHQTALPSAVSTAPSTIPPMDLSMSQPRTTETSPQPTTMSQAPMTPVVGVAYRSTDQSGGMQQPGSSSQLSPHTVSPQPSVHLHNLDPQPQVPLQYMQNGTVVPPTGEKDKQPTMPYLHDMSRVYNTGSYVEAGCVY